MLFIIKVKHCRYLINLLAGLPVLSLNYEGVVKKFDKSNSDLTIIDNVKSVRIPEGYTQTDIAVFINVQRGYLGQIESARTKAK